MYRTSDKGPRMMSSGSEVAPFPIAVAKLQDEDNLLYLSICQSQVFVIQR